MRYLILLLTLSVPVLAQRPAHCAGVAVELDARCGCVRDPNSKLCEMVKAGFYDPDRAARIKPLSLGWTGAGLTPGAGVSRPNGTRTQPARPRQARVAPIGHREYLRFLHPNAQLVAGSDLERLIQAQELMGGLFGGSEGSSDRVMAALKEVDHLWLSVAPGNDVVLLMTGRFEGGAAAGLFYAQGIHPVFLGDARAMMIGSEASIQGALARLSKPMAGGGWVARRARDLSKDHETWIVSERTVAGNGPLQAVRQFALGLRVIGEAGIDAEITADSPAGAEAVAAWVEQMKSSVRQTSGGGALDSIQVKRDGTTVRFYAKDDGLLTGDSGKAAMRSDFGVELYAIMMSGFPGMTAKTVPEEKVLAVKPGMTREDLLELLGPPVTVFAVQGLETPRETWTYLTPFGPKYTARLEGGVVSAAPSASSGSVR